VAGDAALLVDPLDVAAIAEGLGVLLADAGLREGLRRAGAERVRTFTWEASASRTADILKAAGARA
jgi:glycosyltransferase involved in cell wall biosynthesis